MIPQETCDACVRTPQIECTDHVCFQNCIGWAYTKLVSMYQTAYCDSPIHSSMCFAWNGPWLVPVLWGCLTSNLAMDIIILSMLVTTNHHGMNMCKVFVRRLDHSMCLIGPIISSLQSHSFLIFFIFQLPCSIPISIWCQGRHC